MHSPERTARTSLRTRVAVAAAIVAALVGLVAASAAALLIDELEVAAHDRRLIDAASLMQREIASEGGDARRHVDDEAVEIGVIGLRMALFENGQRIAGAADIAFPAGEGCVSRDGPSGPSRACAVGGEARRVVVSTHREGGNGRRGLLFGAVGASALLAALVSALGSHALAGWALRPLTALGARIEKISESDPREADLGEPSGIAEVDAVREALRSLLDRLGEAVERSRGFAASAAHELRTPLATMMAELELASEDGPPHAASLTRVQRSLGRLSVVVERLLTLASGRASDLVNEAVALEDVVRDVIGARREADRARVESTLDASGMVRGDEALLRIVVDNLVDNALKFAPTGKVHVIVTEGSGEVRLTVRDHGPGVDPAEAERFFLPFARGSEPSAPGHGLGLAIVAHAVRLHGGDIRFVTRGADEAPDGGHAGAKGAELRVTFPAWTASPAT
jgi:signal transduction histidine kinase